MKKLFLFALSMVFWGSAMAQTKELKREGGEIPGGKNTVTKVSIQAETERTVSLQAEFKGFDEKGKSYKITATMLNQVKSPMKEFETVTVDLDPKSGIADFNFVFTQRTGIKYDPTGIESKFVEFTVAEKNAASSLPGADLIGFGARKFVFQFRKKWRVKVPVTVDVKPVPFKSAATIKP